MSSKRKLCNNSYENRLLTSAVFACNLKDVKYAIKLGAKVRNDHLAAVVINRRCYKPSLIQILLDSGASSNTLISQKGSWYGETVLHASISLKKLKYAKLLVRRGANVNACGLSKKTPLMDAITTNNVSGTHLLIMVGADLNTETIAGCTPLMLALLTECICSTQGKKTKIVDILLFETKLSPNHTNRFGITALMTLSEYFVNDHRSMKYKFTSATLIDAAKKLLKAGANIHQKDVKGNAALHYACSCKAATIPFLNFLITEGADVNQEGEGGNTPLMVLIENNVSDVIDKIMLLIQAGANVNQKNAKGTTALILTAINSLNDFKTSTCIQMGNIAQFLIDVGCDVNARNNKGLSAIDIIKFIPENSRYKEYDNYLAKILICGGASFDMNRISGSEFDVLNKVWKSRCDMFMQLQYKCREQIRSTLLNSHSKLPLLHSVNNLNLPKRLKTYLLKNLSLMFRSK